MNVLNRWSCRSTDPFCLAESKELLARLARGPARLLDRLQRDMAAAELHTHTGAPAASDSSSGAGAAASSSSPEALSAMQQQARAENKTIDRKPSVARTWFVLLVAERSDLS